MKRISLVIGHCYDRLFWVRWAVVCAAMRRNACGAAAADGDPIVSIIEFTIPNPGRRLAAKLPKWIVSHRPRDEWWNPYAREDGQGNGFCPSWPELVSREPGREDRAEGYGRNKRFACYIPWQAGVIASEVRKGNEVLSLRDQASSLDGLATAPAKAEVRPNAAANFG